VVKDAVTADANIPVIVMAARTELVGIAAVIVGIAVSAVTAEIAAASAARLATVVAAVIEIAAARAAASAVVAATGTRVGVASAVANGAASEVPSAAVATGHAAADAMTRMPVAATERLARESPGGASKAIATKVRDAAIAVTPTGVTAMVSAEMANAWIASAEMETAGTAIAHRLRPELKATSAATRIAYRMTLVIALIHP
jgi:hypothetical protein